MSKPKWEDAPPWAQYLAMDGDGYWVWFENQPEWQKETSEWIDYEDEGRIAPVVRIGDGEPVDLQVASSDLYVRPR